MDSEKETERRHREKVRKKATEVGTSRWKIQEGREGEKGYANWTAQKKVPLRYLELGKKKGGKSSCSREVGRMDTESWERRCVGRGGDIGSYTKPIFKCPNGTN